VKTIVQPPVAQLPWKLHPALLDKLDSVADRLWYTAKQWSKDEHSAPEDDQTVAVGASASVNKS
jgi:hypothetical protein